MKQLIVILSKYWKEFIILLGVIGLYLWRKFKTRPLNAEKLGSALVGNNTEIQNIARELSIKLGFAYPVYDPRRWFEYDQDIYMLIRNLSKEQINAVSLVYFRVYAKGRDLKSDLAKYLDSKYYNQLTNL